MVLETIITMITGFIFGKVIEIAIRDFRKYGWRIPNEKDKKKNKEYLE